ncbi:NAD-dependent epimerase/dehydratase family protein [Ornithinimicrobium avium]|uniref:NAD-dependent epimerase/dehydratase family protein n=1 Tax=Ornithinimicrobium avium TaxID=2283195 RepID=A0A345NRK3_9MICO|nr:NAD-dependent epimerase/dehydratase family protein [Ornithinimicrobium avium]AXH97661.1 NAD-dependent epimerase/dehydratase family protein [Ornithinimicrobium avium]
MSSTTSDAARRAGAGCPPRIALTRAAGGPASAVAGALVRRGHAVVGLDVRAGERGDVEWRPCDVAAPSVVRALDDVDLLVHLVDEHDLAAALREPAGTRRGRLLGEATALTTAAAAAGVPHLVLVTSAMVFGARPDNPVPLPEDAPLRTLDPEGSVADLVAVEEEVATLARLHPQLRVSVVRPAALVGGGADTIITRHFEAPRLLTLRGTSPAWTFCHVEDLGTALSQVAHGAMPSELTVSSPGWLSQHEVEELSGMRRVELAEPVARAAADRLHRLGVVPVPADDLAYVAHPWATEPVALLGHGWVPAHDNAACLAVLLAGGHGHHAVMARRVTARDAVGAAAAGAASAAVAVIATAALTRRRRPRG